MADSIHFIITPTLKLKLIGFSQQIENRGNTVVRYTVHNLAGAGVSFHIRRMDKPNDLGLEKPYVLMPGEEIMVIGDTVTFVNLRAGFPLEELLTNWIPH